MSSLKSLSEVFITSTLREVQPVAMIGERRLFPGAVTIMLRKAYKDLLDDIDP
jgi:branched-subunit amino acid aminotransferase/4-amino-4-deoxychorismate lyase